MSIFDIPKAGVALFNFLHIMITFDIPKAWVTLFNFLHTYFAFDAMEVLL